MPRHQFCDLQLSLLKKELSNLGCIHAGYDCRGLEHIDVWNSSMAREIPGARHLPCKQRDDSEILRTDVEKSLHGGPHR